ncbi:MAG: phage tail tape measure protein [Ectothiorhodospiraceae bacterium]|nr:phage tail tape measure protein [Ectothiorhodospiraceae bacterium]MCH8502924.1 phage tail tape measure protein [Ectothiorhodospiraceae bacterium]
MPSSIAERIRFVLTADTAQLERGMGNAGRTVRNQAQGMEREFRQLQRTALRLTGIIAGLAGAAGLQALIRQSINTAEEIQKLGLRTGETAEFLSTLAFAAEQNDSSLKGLSTGLRNLAQNMDQAARDGSAAVDLFRRVGVDATDADGNLRGLGETLFDIADRFQQMENPAQRAALAQQLFGRSGEELIPLLMQGSEGIQQLQADAERYGREISGRLAQRAADFNDQLNILRSRAQGVGLALADQVLPLLLAITQEFDNAAEGATGMQAAIEGLGYALRILVLGLRTVIFLAELGGEVLGALAASVAELARGNFSGARQILNELLPENLEGRVQGLTDFYDALFNSEEEITEEVRARQRLRALEAGAQEESARHADEQEKKEQRINAQIRDRNRELDGARRRLRGLTSEREELEKLFAGLRGEAAREGAPESVLDVQRLRAESDAALRAGHFDTALEKARDAARIIGDLQEDDTLRNASIQTIREVERIALEAAKAREAQAEQEVLTLEQQVAALKEELEGVGDIDVTFDEQQLQQAADQARDFLDKLFKRNPLNIPVLAEAGDGGGRPRAPGAITPVYHSGGPVPGQGEQLARLLGGEGVLNRSAMDFIGGASGLGALNQQQAPAALAGAAGGGRAVHLHMDGRDYGMTAPSGVADDLERRFRREALKRGGPRG